MKKPKAVLISDVHYNIHTLELADKAMRMAIEKANELNVTLIIAGDLHDTKANMRAECIKAMLKTINTCRHMPFVLVGNHDKINEKSEDDALHFLGNVAYVISELIDFLDFNSSVFIPYSNDIEKLRLILKQQDTLKQVLLGSAIIMHQGLQGSNSGDYIQDKTALNKQDVSGLRIISGHYHYRQTIDLPNGGKWDYIGNPYTLNFGEANDPPKGFQILYDDNSLEFVPTNLRKHIKIDINLKTGECNPTVLNINPEDLVWVKVSGTREQLLNTTKQSIAKQLQLTQDFKLDLIPESIDIELASIISKTQPELLDSLIDSLQNSSDSQKNRLKSLWKDLCE